MGFQLGLKAGIFTWTRRVMWMIKEDQKRRNRLVGITPVWRAHAYLKILSRSSSVLLLLCAWGFWVSISGAIVLGGDSGRLRFSIYNQNHRWCHAHGFLIHSLRRIWLIVAMWQCGSRFVRSLDLFKKTDKPLFYLKHLIFHSSNYYLQI